MDVFINSAETQTSFPASSFRITVHDTSLAGSPYEMLLRPRCETADVVGCRVTRKTFPGGYNMPTGNNKAWAELHCYGVQ